MAEWGGDWTVKKKKVLKMYLQMYQMALKNQTFEKWYIDAFAGVGVHTPKRGKAAQTSSIDFGPIEVDNQELEIRSHGSPLIALNTKPPFDKYVFIEKKESHCEALRKTIKSLNVNSDIYIRNKDANNELMDFCRWITGKTNIRGVLFLDPYGMEVSWSTLSAVAGTGIIDVWYLFPTMAVKRMLPKSGEVRPAWKKRLNLVLGSTDWESILYIPNEKKSCQMDLFGELTEDAPVRPVPEREIEAYAVQRMNSIFPFVANPPLSLYNTKGRQLFSLIFAMSNESNAAIKLGKKIMNYIAKVNQEVT